MKIKSKFVLTISVISFIGTGVMIAWIAFASYRSTLKQVTSEVNNLSSVLTETVYSLMASGQQERLETYLQKAHQLKSLENFHIVRSSSLEKELGAKKSAETADNIDDQVLQSGQEMTKVVKTERFQGLRRVLPIFANKECLTCHTSAREGETLAAMSMTISYQQSLNEMFGDCIRTGLIMFLLVFLVIVSVFFLFDRLIMDRISKMKLFANQLGSGDLTATLDIGVEDEIGELASELSDFSKKILQMLLQIRDAGLQVNTSSVEISTATQEQVSGAVQQSSAVSQASTTIKQLASSAANIAQNAESVSTTTERTLAGIQEINNKVEATARRILALGEKSEAISSIAKLIDDVADQTNLLALNAAIEAARAGEAGRGFAVVAQEVRKLSERSSESTDEIRKLIAEIQSETNATIIGIENSTQWVSKGLEMIKETVYATKEISIATQQQRTASEQTVQAIQNINVVTKQFASNTQQTAVSAARLNRLALELKKAIGEFKLEQ